MNPLPKPTDRDCLKCQHCWIDGGDGGYSEYTPATPATFTCLKAHWCLDAWTHRTDPQHVDRKTLHEALQTAKTCTDYEEEPPI